MRTRYREGVVTLQGLGEEFKCSHALIYAIVQFRIYNNKRYSGEHDGVQEYIANNAYLIPEKGLVDAMLVQAREDIVQRPETEFSNDAIEWLLGEHDQWGFSFENVAEYLNLDVSSARNAILEKAEPKQVQMIKKRLLNNEELN